MALIDVYALARRGCRAAAMSPRSRDAAFEAFRAGGLPHRRVEAWKYTDLRAVDARMPSRCGAARCDGKALARDAGACWPDWASGVW